MVDPLDVTARLAEGRPSVDDVGEYVAACHRLGFQHQDLTAHPTQVRDWYDSEDGLDLKVLDADCAAMAAAATAAEDAARTQVDLVAELSGAWSGRGATAAREFAWRSGQAATMVATEVRRAADALTALRDESWRAVDQKVAAVQTIDGRHRAERGEWLAAAKTVTTGAGDLAAASELVDQQVKPFVTTDVASDWIGAMRTAIATIGAAYDRAIATTSRGPLPVFDVPGALGPRADPSGAESTASVATTPASAGPAALPSAAATFTPMGAAPTSAPGWGAPTSMAAPAAVEPMSSPPAAPAALPPVSSTPPTGDLGGTAPGLGSGASGFGQQLADLIGGLVGSFGGTDDLTDSDPRLDTGLDPGSEALDDPALDEEEEKATDGDDGDDGDEDEEGDDGEEAAPLDAGEAAETLVEPGAEGVEETAPEPPEPTPVPPPPAPAPAPAAPESMAATAEPTPCEIAADELPQVGE